MRILITGGSGLLGGKLAEIALREGHEVFSAYRKHKPSYGHPIQVDLLNEDDVVKMFRIADPDVVVHAAAITDVDRCEIERDLAYRVNALGTKVVAELSRKFGSFLIYISTDYVFDGTKGTYSEEDKPNPVNYYGHTKLIGEKFCSGFCVARTSVIYGAGSTGRKMNFALWIIRNLSSGRKVKVVEDQLITPTLNTNLAEMLLEVAEKRLRGVIHLAGATKVSRLQFALEVAKSFELDVKKIIRVRIRDINWIAKRPRDSSLSTVKARVLLERGPLDLRTAVKIFRKELEASSSIF